MLICNFDPLLRILVTMIVSDATRSTEFTILVGNLECDLVAVGPLKNMYIPSGFKN